MASAPASCSRASWPASTPACSCCSGSACAAGSRCCALLWGLSAGALGFIQTHAQFYVLRVLIGFAEGGLAPGIVLYLSQFATERERATTFTLPMLAIPAVGDHRRAAVGLAARHWSTDCRSRAGVSCSWPRPCPPCCWDCSRCSISRTRRRRSALAQRRGARAGWRKCRAARGRPQRNDWSVLRQPLVGLSGLLWFCLLSGSYGVIFWLPQVIHSLTGFSPLAIGLVGALPWVGVAIGMYFNARAFGSHWRALLARGRARCRRCHARCWPPGRWGPAPRRWRCCCWRAWDSAARRAGSGRCPRSCCAPASFGVAVVAINILGSAGGFVMPQLMGIAREHSGGFTAPTLLVVAVLLLAVRAGGGDPRAVSPRDRRPASFRPAGASSPSSVAVTGHASEPG